MTSTEGICPIIKHLYYIQELKILSVNFVPEYSTKGRRLFAVIALGESHTPDVSLFASIHENKKQQLQASKKSPTYLIDQPDYCTLVDEHYDVDENALPSSEKENIDINGTSEFTVVLDSKLYFTT